MLAPAFLPAGMLKLVLNRGGRDELRIALHCFKDQLTGAIHRSAAEAAFAANARACSMQAVLVGGVNQGNAKTAVATAAAGANKWDAHAGPD